MKKRLLAQFPAHPRMDDFDLQIRFESWVRHFPHIREIYDRKRLIVRLDEDNNFLVEARMSDKQFTLWCLKHPNTPAGDWVGVL
jgi:hypothetical protein